MVSSVLASRYRLDAVIGRGGMGTVYSATDTKTGAHVALKLVERDAFGDHLMARLEREAQAAQRIQSEFVPRVLDVQREDTAGGLFVVMELLVGETLAQRFARGLPLEWKDVDWIVRDVLRALIDAHTAGVVHRDLKPSNIFLERREDGRARARILDFGICKLDTDEHMEKLTVGGETLGTVAYMAPEQIRGASQVDERADLYALGSVVFEALTAELTHESSGQMAMLARKLERPARSLDEWARVYVPPKLDALMERALARKPEQRFRTAQEMLKAWRTLGEPTLAPRQTLRTEAEPTLSPTTTQRPTSFRGGTSGVMVAIAAGVVALAAAAVLVLRSHAAPAAPVAEDLPAAASIPGDAPAAPSAAALAQGATAPASAVVVEPPLEDLDEGPPVKGGGKKPRRWRKPHGAAAPTAATSAPKASGTSPYQISPTPRY